MGGTFTSLGALKTALQSELYSAMAEVSSQGHERALANARAFYSSDAPKRYVRTGTYGGAPRTDGVTGGNNTVRTAIYMDEGVRYSTGTFSATQVFEAAEHHTSGVLGMPGRWAQTEQDVQNIIDNVFSAHFS